MRYFFTLTVLGFALFTTAAMGAAKPHAISFSKATAIKWCVGPNEAECLNLKARSLYVDGLVRESTLGARMKLRNGCSQCVARTG
jgi:hypothetical protein